MKPSLPAGTRDFPPSIVRKRRHILETIRKVFETYGFEPLETPAMENLDTLLGKYGEEGDKLIFRILNNGLDNPAKRAQIEVDFKSVLEGKSVKGITERALRYDLTIPFARFVAMNHGQLHFPFKRYQMQPVWRADRPQKGRYREFYQCDADVVGSTSLWNELDLACIYRDVFQLLQVPAEIRVNHRKVLTALAKASGGSDSLNLLATTIDKIDKIGIDQALSELEVGGYGAAEIKLIRDYLHIKGSVSEILSRLRELLKESPEAFAALEEMDWLVRHYEETSQGSGIRILPDLTLARGLNYYTGMIFEIRALGVQIGSIGGGGRYDDLTGLFGLKGVPGVGISFGVDRIFDVMEALSLFPQSTAESSRVLFFNLGGDACEAAFALVQQLRSAGIAAELYHETAKFDRQFRYAEKKQIPTVVIIGEAELQAGTCVIKDLASGVQQTIRRDQILDHIS